MHFAGAWFKSIFVRRRWTLLTASPFLVTACQWVINHFSTLPSDLRTASVWDAPWWAYVLSFLLCLSVSQALAWGEQHKLNRSLIDGFPRIVLADEPVDKSPFILRTAIPLSTDSSGPTVTVSHDTYMALRLRVANRPHVNTEKASTDISARVSFFDSNGSRVVLMDGRWSDSPQLTERDASQDYVRSLAVPFPVGAQRSLDLVFQRPGEAWCVAINNDNFRFERLDMPDRKLSGLVMINIELNGVYVKAKITAQVSCEKLEFVGPITIEDLMPGSKPMLPSSHQGSGQRQEGEKILTRLNEATGNLGKIYYSYRKGNPIWTLRIEGFDKVQTAFGSLWPHLCEVKKARFKEVLKTCTDNFRSKPEHIQRQSKTHAINKAAKRKLAA